MPHLLFEFEAPRLRHLTLFYAFDHQFDPIDGSVTSSGRFPVLESLNFSNTTIMQPYVCAIFFKVCPSITDVSFIDSKSTSEAFLYMLAGASDTDIDAASCWPSLRTVTFNSLPHSWMINAMLYRRIADSLPMAKVRLHQLHRCVVPSILDVDTPNVDVGPLIVEYDAESWLKDHEMSEEH